MAVVQVEDMEGQAEVVIFPAVYRRCASLLEPDAVLLFKGRAEANEDTPRLLASEVGLLRDASKRARHRSAQTLRIAVTVGDVAPHLASTLRDVLERHRGSIPVYVDVSCSDSDGFRARIAPNRYLFVDPTDALMGELEQLLGAGCARPDGLRHPVTDDAERIETLLRAIPAHSGLVGEQEEQFRRLRQRIGQRQATGAEAWARWHHCSMTTHTAPRRWLVTSRPSSLRSSRYGRVFGARAARPRGPSCRRC